MLKDILSSDPFLTMVKTIIWWAIIALIVVVVSYASGVLSHPLIRAKKRVSKFRLHSLCISSTLKSIKTPSKNKKKLIKSLRKLMLKKKTIASSINVYIYDDTANNMGSGFSKSCLKLIDGKLRDALTYIMEDDYISASKSLEESATIAMDLYKRLDEIVKKENNERMWRI